MPGFIIAYGPEVVQADVVVRALRRVAYPTFKFLLLVVGVYVLTFLLTSQSLPALVAAVAAGLTTYIPIILEAGHNSKFVAVSWVPWVILVFLLVLRRPGILSGFTFAAVLALALRAGHVQIIYNLFFLLAVWWVAVGAGAFKDRNARPFLMSTLWLAAGGILALLMVAQPYLSQYEYKSFSTRGGAAVPVDPQADVGSGLAFDYAMAWSQGWFEMLTYLIAGAMGGGPDAYWGEKPFTSGPHYLGGIIIALAAVAVFGKRSRTAIALGSGVLLVVLFALGENMAFVNRLFFNYFPLFNSFRAPEIWLHMVEIGLAVLAGIGAAWIIKVVSGSSGKGSGSRASRASQRRTIWVGFGSVLFVTAVLYLVAPSMLSFSKEGERTRIEYAAARQANASPDSPQVQAMVDQYLEGLRDERAERFRSDAARTTLFLIIAAVGLFLLMRGSIPGWAFLALLILLVTIDLWGVGKRHLSADAYSTGTVAERIPEYDFDRFIKEQVELEGGPGHFRTLSLESSPTDWARPAYHYEVVSGYNAAKLAVYQDLIDHLGLGGRGSPPHETMLDLTATRFIVSAQQLPGTRAVFVDQSTGLAVFERPRSAWVHRTHLVDSVVVVPDARSALDAIKQDAFDRTEAAVIMSDPGPLAPIDSTSMAAVELVRYDAHHAEWRVDSDGRRLLVTSEIFYPAGWSAQIDGQSVDILRVNHAFRGVVVPAGEHVVSMRFHPKSHHLGVLISLLATIFVYGVLATLAVLFLFRRKRETPES
jgi:hypothetical protein